MKTKDLVHPTFKYVLRIILFKASAGIHGGVIDLDAKTHVIGQTR